MFLHIGDNLIVSFTQIISILNYNTSEFIGKEKNDSKSIIIAEVDNKIVVYYSNISSKTLFSRFESFLEGDSQHVIGI